MSYTEESYQSIFNDKETPGLDDVHRAHELSHWNQAREIESHFQIAKALDSDGSWPGLWLIRSKDGCLPKELDQKFTDQLTAINHVKAYLNKVKGTKENV